MLKKSKKAPNTWSHAVRPPLGGGEIVTCAGISDSGAALTEGATGEPVFSSVLVSGETARLWGL